MPRHYTTNPYRQINIATKTTLWIHIQKPICHRHGDICSGSMSWLGLHSHGTNKKWIYESDKFQRSLGSTDFTGHPKVFKTPTYDTILAMWLQFIEFEDGRSHLGTGHWCKPLIDARRITIDDDDLQDIPTHFIKCEWIKYWSRTLGEIRRS